MALILCTSEKNTKPSYQTFAAHSPFWGDETSSNVESFLNFLTVFVLPLLCVRCGIHTRFLFLLGFFSERVKALLFSSLNRLRDSTFRLLVSTD